MKQINCCLLLLLLSVVGKSQEKDPAITFRAGVMGTSTAVYDVKGTDTTYKNQFAFAPTLSLLHETGFSLDYAAYFIAGGNTPGLYMHIVTLGYENYDGKNFTIRTGYNHYFFTKNKSIPYSPITNELYLATDYKKTWLRPALSVGFGFGKDESNTAVSDINLGLGIKHGFDFENAGPFTSIDLGPSVFVNGGTNSYYSFLTSSKYLSRNKSVAKSTSQNRGRGNSGNSGNSGNTGSSTTVSQAVNSFELRNFEVGFYSDFAHNHIHIKPQGSIYVPFTKDQGGIGGYWQVNLEYYF